MTEQITQRLKQEVTAQLTEQQKQQELQQIIAQPQQPQQQVVTMSVPPRPIPVVRQATVSNNSSTQASSQQATVPHSNQRRRKDMPPSDNFRICGIPRRCWGAILCLLLVVVVGAGVGTVFYLRQQEDETPNLRPSSPPSTIVPIGNTTTADRNRNYLLETIGPTIAFPDLLIFCLLYTSPSPRD